MRYLHIKWILISFISFILGKYLYICYHSPHMSILKSMLTPHPRTTKHIKEKSRHETMKERKEKVLEYNALYDLSSKFTADTDNVAVPNIVHYIWVDKGKGIPFTFLNALSFFSVHNIWKPRIIYIHANQLPTGPWWQLVELNIGNIKHIKIDDTQVKIYGKIPLYTEHLTDILRLEILQDYGGVYIDTDIIAMRPLSPLRHFGHTQGIGMLDKGLSNGVILAKQGSPFLKIWHEAYWTYGRIPDDINSTVWRYHSIELPGTLHSIFPRMIHTEQTALLGPKYFQYENETIKERTWQKNYCVHIWKRFTKVPEHPNDFKFISKTSFVRELLEYVWFQQTIPILKEGTYKIER
ncbi:unnamed protein product [Owenia fusiformis]|uniref:Uncharacterized protein n=1 Tax=Owenia fusiformis TaxID=6347 RepID=A0A8J1UZD5_OWEFU|nr:unnamed protein product [Owenia fusiformis]